MKQFINYNDTIRHTIENEEGGWVYTDHVDDPDEGTYAGVRYKTYCAWRQRNELPLISKATFMVDVQEGSEGLKREIIDCYREFFWDRMKLDGLPEYLRPMMFSCGVNLGTDDAVRFLQKVINNAIRRAPNGDEYEIIAEDGVIGGITISEARMWLTFNTELQRQGVRLQYFYHWQSYYNRLVETNARAWMTFAKTARGKEPLYLRATFLQGWFNRAFKYVEIE